MAVLLLDELTSEQHRDESFAKSQDKLAAIAHEALGEFRHGKTKPIKKDGDLGND